MNYVCVSAETSEKEKEPAFTVGVVILQMGIRFMLLHQDENTPSAFAPPIDTYPCRHTDIGAHTPLDSTFISSRGGSGDAFITKLMTYPPSPHRAPQIQ